MCRTIQIKGILTSGDIVSVSILWLTRTLTDGTELGSAFIPAVPLLFGIFYCPESPRWLIRKNRPREAYFSLLRLRGQRRELLAARDLYYIHEELSSNPEGGSTIEDTFGRFKELFVGKKRVRRATVAASTAMIAQQLCGSECDSLPLFVQAGF